jgi:hypothetical protein
MLQKVIVALAVAIVLGNAGFSTSAFARGNGSGGGAAGFRNNFFGPSIRGGRIANDSCIVRRTRSSCDRPRGYAPRDVWGHLGNYYGPMVHVS